MGLLADTMSAAMFSLGMVIMTVVLLRRIVRYRKKLNRGDDTRASITSQCAKPTVVPVEMLRWQVEMHDLARDLKAELDSKMSALQSLIRMAKEETARLERTIVRAESVSIESAMASRDEDECDSSQFTETITRQPELARLPGSRKQRNTVFCLADLGKPTPVIADEIGASLGDVELILNSRGCLE